MDLISADDQNINKMTQSDVDNFMEMNEELNERRLKALEELKKNEEKEKQINQIKEKKVKDLTHEDKKNIIKVMYNEIIREENIIKNQKK